MRAVVIAAVRPRCPYAALGIDSAEMAACSGFAPETVEVGAEHVVGRGRSCRHLRAQRDPAREGAFVSACTHPVLGVPVAGEGNGNGVRRGGRRT